VFRIPRTGCSRSAGPAVHDRRNTHFGKAEEQLAALERICLIPREEYEDLKKAVADYRARTSP